MSLDELMITCFCITFEMVPACHERKAVARTRIPAKLADSEVITIEVIGSYLGLSQDSAPPHSTDAREE